jgi:hypothetical protein
MGHNLKGLSMFRTICVSTLSAAAMLFLTGGCESKKTDPKPVATPEHHHHGPNEGEVIELVGDGDYHAELLQDVDHKTVTVFLLGQDVKTPVTTAADKLVIRITHQGTPTEFVLAPKEGETAGNVSKFESKDEALTLALGNETAERELEVTIGDKPYKAKFPYYEPHHHGDAVEDEHKDGHKDEEKGKDAKP